MKRCGKSTIDAFLRDHFKYDEFIFLNNTNLSFTPSFKFRRGRIDIFDRAKREKGEARCFINTVEHFLITTIGESLKVGYCYDTERARFAIKYGKDLFSKEVYNIVVLRSPHNHLAAMLKKKSTCKLMEGTSYYMRFLDLWLQYAEEVLCITDYIPDKVIVLFDKFISSHHYRKTISAALGIPHVDSDREIVIGNSGSGSWKYFIDSDGRKVGWMDDTCEEILFHPKIIEYTKELFSIDLMECFNE